MPGIPKEDPEMRQAIEVKTRVGGILPQNYVVQFEHNHSRIILGGKCLYDGDEQRGWQWLSEEIDRAEAIAKAQGLSFERLLNC